MWAKVQQVNSSPSQSPCGAGTPATALKPEQSRTHSLLLFLDYTIKKGSKEGQSNRRPALLFIVTVNINVPSEYSAPSQHFAGFSFPLPSSVLLAFRAMAHLCQMRWFGIWLHALCSFSFLNQTRERSQTGTWYWVLLIAKGRNNLQQVWRTAAASMRCISWCTAVVKHWDAFELFVFLQDTKHLIMSFEVFEYQR